MLNFTQRGIVEAHQRGYFCTPAGIILDPEGVPVKLTVHVSTGRATRYMVFHIPSGQSRGYSVEVHRFIGYAKYGDAIFNKKIQLRHLNENSLDNRPENIEIGTPTQNHLDRPAAVRIAHARHAGQAQRRCDDTLVAQIRFDRAQNVSYRVLGQRYGLSKSTLSFMLSPVAKKRSLY